MLPGALHRGCARFTIHAEINVVPLDPRWLSAAHLRLDVSSIPGQFDQWLFAIHLAPVADARADESSNVCATACRRVSATKIWSFSDMLEYNGNNMH